MTGMNHGPTCPLTTREELRSRWQLRCEEFARFGVLVDGAKVVGELLAELDAAMSAEGEELLSLTVAARLSGYSPSHLSRLLRSGLVPNSGRQHRPLIRRKDLPNKAKHSLASGAQKPYDPSADARALMGRQGER